MTSEKKANLVLALFVVAAIFTCYLVYGKWGALIAVGIIVLGTVVLMLIDKWVEL